MIRRLTLLLAALIATDVYGLGLGELDLDSGLNQEFRASIVLTNTRDLTIDEVLPNLASQDDFDRVGVERAYHLTGLRFAVVEDEAGQLVVKLTSTNPIIEPYLNFIVEVLWPSGRILREYTVLLDPPVFGEEGVQPLSQSEAGMPPAATPSRPSSTTSQSGAQARREATDDEYGMTTSADTLWAIALEVRPDSSISVQQTMLALQRGNPDAFINGNINLLKAGHQLRIPSLEEIGADDFNEAVEEVQAQNDEFYNRSERPQRRERVAQLDASRQRERGSPSTDSDDGELRLLASDNSRGSRAGDSGSNAELENELAVAMEDLDRARRANTEINVKIGDLASQVETLNEIVKLKDDQLAELRARFIKMQEMDAAAPIAPAPPPATGGMLTNPIVLGGVGLVVILAVAGGLFVIRRRQQTAPVQEDNFTITPRDDIQPVEDLLDDVAVDSIEIDEAENEDVSPQTADVISEAEIYIAYGRFAHAMTFLQNAINAEPNRADLQLKLLEVYVETEDAIAFNLQYEQLRELGDDAAIAQAGQLQAKIPGAAESAAASFDATIIAAAPIVAIDEPAAEDDLDLEGSLNGDDELDLDLDMDDDGADLSGAEELDLDLALGADDGADDGDGELDLDLNLDGDLDGDLDLASGDDELNLNLDDDAGDLSMLTESDDDDGAIELDMGDDDLDLDRGLDDKGDGLALDTAADLVDLDLDDVDLDDVDLGLDDDASGSLDSSSTMELDADELDLDGDLSLDLDSDDDGLSLDLAGDDDELSLNLDDDDALDLDLGDDDLGDDDLDLNLDDDLSLDLDEDEDAGTKLDLARAYIDMGDGDSAKGVLAEVIKGGSESQIQEANEMLEKID